MAPRNKSRVVKGTPKVGKGQPSASVDPAASMFEREEAMEAVQTPAKRQRPGRTIEEQVKKKLNYHFKDFTDAQTTTLLDSTGRNLYQTLTHDVELYENKDPKSPSWGKNYYDELKKRFAYTDSPYKQLKVVDSLEGLDDGLVTALTGLHTAQKDFESVKDYLDSAPMINQKSLVLLFRNALKVSPNGGIEGVGFLEAVLKFCDRHRVPTSHPAEWGCVKGHFDEAVRGPFLLISVSSKMQFRSCV